MNKWELFFSTSLYKCGGFILCSARPPHLTIYKLKVFLHKGLQNCCVNVCRKKWLMIEAPVLFNGNVSTSMTSIKTSYWSFYWSLVGNICFNCVCWFVFQSLNDFIRRMNLRVWAITENKALLCQIIEAILHKEF